MKRMYLLSTCTTCARIIKETGINNKGFELHDIKTQPVTAKALDEMKKMAGSYEALSSKRALLYKTLGLKDMQLTEDDYRRYLLQEYTFLKRPVTIIDKQIFVGSEKKTVEALKKSIS